MGGMRVCRVAWSAGTAIALGMIVSGSASAGVWSPMPQSPQMVGIYNGKSQYVTGQTLVVVEGQTLKLLGRSMDIDTRTEGTTTSTSLDRADVLWTAIAGSVAPSRARSEDEVLVTPPAVPPGAPYFTFTVMAQADDYRTQDDPPGSLAPDTGNRNDAYGSTQTVTIKGPLSYTMLKAGLPTKTVNCKQVYKCKDTNLTPSFKITRSFSNVTVGGYRRNQVPTTKTPE